MGVEGGKEREVDRVVEELKHLSKATKDKKEIAQVATIAANNDKTIGNLIAEAMEKVGKDGVITVEEAKTMETSLEVVEGMQFDRGYLSPRSEERRVGKECRSRWSTYDEKKKERQLIGTHVTCVRQLIQDLVTKAYRQDR